MNFNKQLLALYLRQWLFDLQTLCIDKMALFINEDSCQVDNSDLLFNVLIPAVQSS